MKKTGELLKEAREKQGVSVNAVSAATKIGVKVLEAIEAGDLTQLPPKTFVRGFVQTYAAHLKLDPKTVLDVFQEEVGTTRYNPVIERPPEEEGAPAKSSAMTDKPGSSLTKWLLLGLALLLTIAIYFVSQTVQKYKKESEISKLPTEVEDEMTAQLPPPSPKPTAVDAPKAASVDTAVGTPTNAPATTTATAPTIPTAPAAPSASGAPTPASSPGAAVPVSSPVAGSPAASPAASPAGSGAPVATASPAPSPTPTTAPEPTPVPQDVTIEALDAVKIDYSIDGAPVQSTRLEPEQRKKFSAKKSFTADVSDGGAISIFLNGRDKGVPGNLGQPIKLKFPQ